MSYSGFPSSERHCSGSDSQLLVTANYLVVEGILNVSLQSLQIVYIFTSG
jgi:hypothetical protein